MASPAQSRPQYQFGVYTVDLQACELRKLGSRIVLQERPFQLLLALLQRPGDVVTREELRQQLWPDGTFVDFDHNISSAVNKLRTALSDSAKHPSYVETVGRHGYRFIGDVKQVAATVPAARPLPSAVGEAAVPFPSKRGLIPRWALLLTALIFVSALAAYLRWSNSRPPAPAAGRVMLAVLPFENLTGDTSQEYFSDGLTEEMITQLGRLDPERLGVIGRASVNSYKTHQKPLDQVGRELGVQYVLEGSVQRESGNVRVTAQLVQVKDQTQIWARQYDRQLKNLLALQGEITGEIASQIDPILDSSQRAGKVSRPETSRDSYDAYDLYLRGRYEWNKRTADGFAQAIAYFKQAIAKDPSNAHAYAGLADTYALMSTYNLDPPKELMPKAREAALRALHIDEKLAEAHTSLGLIAEFYDWDFPTAEKEFRRAIELDPNYPTGHHWYAEFLAYQGKFPQAFAESERARQLDPLSLIITTDYGAILSYSRQYDRAIEVFEGVLATDPSFSRAHMVVSAYVQKGEFAEALATIKRWQRFEPNRPWSWGSEAIV